MAVGTVWLRRIPSPIAAAFTWVGMGAIALAAFAFNSQTAYPGSLVAVPVVGTALIIAGGTALPRFGAERLLGLRPFGWLGRLSYSLYLWHWPLLVIAAAYAGKSSLPFADDLLLVLLAVALSMLTYRLVENPIRHWSLPSSTSVAAGVGLVVATVAVLSLSIVANGSATTTPIARLRPVANAMMLRHEVVLAAGLTSVPAALQPTLAHAGTDWGGAFENSSCGAGGEQSSEVVCTLGDLRSRRLMVVYGDSQAQMWLPAFEVIAQDAHWRLVVLGKPACPAAFVTVDDGSIPDFPQVCDRWHTWATDWINQHHPDLLVITQFHRYPDPAAASAGQFSGARWHQGLEAMFASIQVPAVREVVLGAVPGLSQSDPVCLAAHAHDVQRCSNPRATAVPPLDQVDRATAAARHVRFIDPVPWFCSNTCTGIIDRYEVYMDPIHVTAIWAKYLSFVLERALNLPA